VNAKKIEEILSNERKQLFKEKETKLKCNPKQVSSASNELRVASEI